MIHLTPLQPLGSSRSCYSLADQLEISPAFAPTGGGNWQGENGWKAVGSIVEKMRTEWGVLTVTDVVYNHTGRN